MRRFVLQLAASTAAVLPDRVRQKLYQLGPVSRALRGALNQAAPEGLSEVSVAAGSLKGTRLLLDLQSEKDLWLGNYEIELQAALTEQLHPGEVFYDLGANIGYISLMAARLLGDSGRVYAFEALPANFARLETNLKLNPEIRTIYPQAIAVADIAGELEFLVHPSDGMGKLKQAAGRQSDYQESIRVQATTLDDFIYKQGNLTPELIKIDIEGGEGLALKGMRRLLQQSQPVLFIELHGPEAAQLVWEELEQAGYTLHAMKKPYPSISTLSELDWKSYVLAKAEDG